MVLVTVSHVVYVRLAVQYSKDDWSILGCVQCELERRKRTEASQTGNYYKGLATTAVYNDLTHRKFV